MKKQGKILIFTLISVGAILIGIGILFHYSHTDTGDLIREKGNIEDLRADISLILNSYDYLVTLIVSSFGIITFLVAYHQKFNVVLSAKSWGLLCAAVILMIGAIIFCLFSREFILNMVTRNAVSLTLASLEIGRWITYICMIFSIVMIGFFALDLAKISKP